MSITTVANRYAKALADVIMERGQTLAVADEITAFAQLIEQSPELREVFASPVISLDRKKAVLKELLGRMQLKPTTNNFLQLLLTNQRLHQIDVIRTSLMKELDERAGVVSADVTTARALTAPEQEKLVNQLEAATGKRVRVNFKINPEIIGGVVTRVGSLIYDGSIKNQLALMKQQLSRG
ncbi:MAG TPA: ATP synthase F1 subunit delta [Blastocatellia bacterium]|nr:ATP synthase F1 subunit delta [Blastocatellia bacterium]